MNFFPRASSSYVKQQLLCFDPEFRTLWLWLWQIYIVNIREPIMMRRNHLRNPRWR